MSENLIGLFPCVVHTGMFTDDPRFVASIHFDTRTGRAAAPDVPVDDPHVRQLFICDDCMITRVNPERERMGLAPVRRPTLPAW